MKKFPVADNMIRPYNFGIMLWLVGYSVSFKDIRNLPRFSTYPGYPEVPFQVLVINLNPNERVEDIRVRLVEQVPINYDITYAMPVDGKVKTYLPEVYPESIVFVGNQGFFRGHNVAFIIVSALQIKNGRVFLNKRVEFDVIKRPFSYPFSKPSYSNPDIWKGTFNFLGIHEYQTTNFVPQDRVDYIILTTESLKEHWKPLADFRNSMGIKTEIFTVEWVISNFNGNSIPERIRNFLRYAYENWGISALLIGADAQYIPPLRTNITLFTDTIGDIYGNWFRNFLLTDYYYSALDGDWNLNDDEWDGSEGDVYADLVPDIMVGRVPFNTPSEIQNYIQTVIRYETSNDFNVPKFAFIGSNLWGDSTDPDSADGCLLNTVLINKLTRISPSQKRLICEHPSAAVRDTLNSFKPTMIFGIGHSNHKIMMTRNSLSAYDAFDYRRVEELNTGNTKFIAGWVGCFINDPFSNSLGLEFVKRNKAVASVGVTKADFGLSVSSIWSVIYDSLNSSSGFPYIGLMVNYGKFAYSYISQYSALYRYLLLSYHIIGDPMLRVYNDARQKLKVSYTINDSLITFTVVDSTTLSPKPFVKISLRDDREVVDYGFTNLSGVLTLRVKRADTLYWTAWHPNSLIYTGSLKGGYSNYALKIDSAILTSTNDTATLHVWIKNVGSSSVFVSPILTSPDLMPITLPSGANISPGTSIRFDWTVVRSPFSDGNRFTKIRIYAGGYADSAYVWIGGPRLVFHSAKWRYYSDTLLLMFEVSNSGSDTAFNVRIVVDSSSLTPLYGNTIPKLAPGEFTNHNLVYYLRGSSPYGEWIRFNLYAGPKFFGTYRIRIDTPNVSIDWYSSEPLNGGITLRWKYRGITGRKYSWRVFVNGRPANYDTLTGSNYTYLTNDFSPKNFSIVVVQDGIEGDTVFSTVEAPNPSLWFVKDIEYIRFSSVPRYSKTSGPIFAQLLTNTAEPEMVTSSAFNRIYALRIDGSEIWRADLGSWIETHPVVADINSDGKLEVIVATTFYLYALRGSDGAILWSVPYPYFPSRPDSTPYPLYLAITKSSSNPNILVVSRKGSIFLYNPSGMLVKYRLANFPDTNSISLPATYDFDGDGNWEIVIKLGDSLHIFDQNLNELPGFPIYVMPSRWLFVWDFIGDGTPEIITCGHRNSIISPYGTIIMVDSSAYNPFSICLPLDFDGDGRDDIAFYHQTFSYVKVYRIDTQFVLINAFSEDASLRGRMATTGDINGDGKDEVIISDARSYLHAYSYIRRDLYGFPIDLSDHNRFRINTVYSTPSLVNHNGYIYIFAPTEANKLYAWRNFGGRVKWGMPFYNRWATNSPVDSLPDEPVLVSVMENVKEKMSKVVFGREYIEIFGEGRIAGNIYSPTGRKVMSVNGEGYVKVDLRGIPRGVYMLKLGKKVYKFIRR